MRAGAIGIAVIGTLFAILAYLQFHSIKEPPAPSLTAVSSCGELRPGLRRIGEHEGFQFDVPVKDFVIQEGWTDVPPPVHGFDIKPKNSTACLSISWREETTQMRPPDPILDSSDYVEKWRVLDDKGKTIGEASWGHWGQGERWRRVRLEGPIQVRYGSKNEREVPRYGSVDENDAALFDRIISSVCRLPSPGQ